ncbi:hypothetical protein PZN02_001058 [Sinorhizobium garamanticum]|uniref:Uncharacterized protein n=1 Tax=Sinorhizobium garamanticum TaxID=680247 RepID=A0ABY8DCF4_9HYPH|nr:hypothetical protein [Sinorhizobium garamanticum]WEX88565.1 hypothetical protein PZN02_001058 [Sinorhizobium garamanticum]
MDDDFFVSTQIDEHRSICISSISKTTFEEAASEYFPNDRGYFICEHDDRLPASGISVLAKVASLEAAYRLVDLWGSLKLNAGNGLPTPS